MTSKSSDARFWRKLFDHAALRSTRKRETEGDIDNSKKWIITAMIMIRTMSKLFNIGYMELLV